MNAPSPRDPAGGDTGRYVALLLASAAVIVAYDAAASWASMAWGFVYSLALVGSCPLYALLGYFAARRHGFGRALLLGAWVGLVDASLGWAVSWWIGPGRLPGGAPSVVFWLETAAVVMSVAVVFAAAGAGIAVLTQPRRRA